MKQVKVNSETVKILAQLSEARKAKNKAAKEEENHKKSLYASLFTQGIVLVNAEVSMQFNGQLVALQKKQIRQVLNQTMLAEKFPIAAQTCTLPTEVYILEVI